MSTIYAIKRKLEAIKMVNAQLNKPKIRLVMWRLGDPAATENDKKGWTLEKEEQVRP